MGDIYLSADASWEVWVGGKEFSECPELVLGKGLGGEEVKSTGGGGEDGLMGGWVGGWVGEIEEEAAVRMRYCGLGMGGWGFTWRTGML